MMVKKNCFFLFFLIFTIIVQNTISQTMSPRLERGLALFADRRWHDAVSELRRAQAESRYPQEHSEALYWIASALLAAGEYEAALADFDELIRINPLGNRSREVAYDKGRALFYLGRYDEAIVLLSNHAALTHSQARKAASLYWVGECLFALGLLDDAQDVFIRIMEEYPASVKYEAATYRVTLINQKKVENELLVLLKWSHEEALRTVEEYQRRERSYDQALIALQKRLADISKDTRALELEQLNAEYLRQIEELRNKLALSEADMDLPPFIPEAPVIITEPLDNSEKTSKLLFLRNQALELESILMNEGGNTREDQK